MAVIEERKNKNGSITYRVKVRVKGQKTASATFERKTDAKEWAAETERELKRLRHLRPSHADTKRLADLVDRYISVELPKRQRTRTDVARHLKWWKTEIGHVLLKDVTPSLLAECRDKLLKSPVERNRHAKDFKPAGFKSAGTVTWYMASLSLAMSIAMKEWEWLDNNPMLRVKKPKLPQPRVRFLDDDEREALLAACQESGCATLYPIVVIALSTGARRGEILNLRWKDIDLERGVARLEQTKNRERRAIPLTHHALTLIKELQDSANPAKTDLVFPRADGLAPVEIGKHWYAALEAAKIKEFRFHDLRHSAASYLAMNGATLAEIAEVLGHKTLQMVKRYAHLSEQHTAKVVERMNRNIFRKRNKTGR